MTTHQTTIRGPWGEPAATPNPLLTKDWRTSHILQCQKQVVTSYTNMTSHQVIQLYTHPDLTNPHIYKVHEHMTSLSLG